MATHVSLIPISLDALSITTRDSPFIKGSARFLVVWTYSNAITPEFLNFLTAFNLILMCLKAVRKLRNSGVIALDYIQTAKNLADPFTKGLSRVVIDCASREMGMRPT